MTFNVVVFGPERSIRIISFAFVLFSLTKRATAQNIRKDMALLIVGGGWKNCPKRVDRRLGTTVLEAMKQWGWHVKNNPCRGRGRPLPNMQTMKIDNTRITGKGGGTEWAEA